MENKRFRIIFTLSSTPRPFCSYFLVFGEIWCFKFLRGLEETEFFRKSVSFDTVEIKFWLQNYQFFVLLRFMRMRIYEDSCGS